MSYTMMIVLIIWMICTNAMIAILAWANHKNVQLIEELYVLEKNIFDLAQNNYSAIKEILKEQAQYQKEPPSLKDMIKDGDQELSKQD